MKTVIDSVNALEGDIKNVIVDDVQRESFASIILCVDSYSNYVAGKYHSFSDEDGEDLISSWQFICTVDEFNACVDELSVAAWIDGISIEEWKAGMKNTVIDAHSNELEIGKVYEFSDDGKQWIVDVLQKFDGSKVPFKTINTGWKLYIRECQSPLGTIKKAQVKLVDGKAYQFESNGSVCIGIFDGDNLQDNNRIYMLRGCTNIIPLVPETK